MRTMRFVCSWGTKQTFNIYNSVQNNLIVWVLRNLIIWLFVCNRCLHFSHFVRSWGTKQTFNIYNSVQNNLIVWVLRNLIIWLFVCNRCLHFSHFVRSWGTKHTYNIYNTKQLYCLFAEKFNYIIICVQQLSTFQPLLSAAELHLNLTLSLTTTVNLGTVSFQGQPQ